MAYRMGGLYNYNSVDLTWEKNPPDISMPGLPGWPAGGVRIAANDHWDICARHSIRPRPVSSSEPRSRAARAPWRRRVCNASLSFRTALSAVLHAVPMHPAFPLLSSCSLCLFVPTYPPSLEASAGSPVRVSDGASHAGTTSAVSCLRSAPQTPGTAGHMPMQKSGQTAVGGGYPARIPAHKLARWLSCERHVSALGLWATSADLQAQRRRRLQRRRLALFPATDSTPNITSQCGQSDLRTDPALGSTCPSSVPITAHAAIACPCALRLSGTLAAARSNPTGC